MVHVCNICVHYSLDLNLWLFYSIVSLRVFFCVLLNGSFCGSRDTQRQGPAPCQNIGENRHSMWPNPNESNQRWKWVSGSWVMGQMGHHFWMGHVGRGSPIDP